MLAKPTDDLPVARSLPGGCLYEPKWDGYRGLVAIDHRGTPHIRSRRGHDLTRAFGYVAAAAADQLPPGSMLDGELVVDGLVECAVADAAGDGHCGDGCLVELGGDALRCASDGLGLLGRFLDDISLPHMTHAAAVRSPHARARIVSVDTSKAEALPGVVRVVTGADVREHAAPLPSFGAGEIVQQIIAVDEVRRNPTTWLARYQRFWDESHERLDELLLALQGLQSNQEQEKDNG